MQKSKAQQDVHRMNSFYKLTVADAMKRDRSLAHSCLGSARQKLDIEQREILLLR